MRMKPIFLSLALLSLAVGGYTFSLGWRYHHGVERLAAEYGAAAIPRETFEETIGGLIGAHFVWGMATGIAVCLVHSLVLVYFLGTGKAIKEQMELKHWDRTDHDDSKRLMGRAVIPSCIGIALIVTAAFSGGFTMIRLLHPDAHLAIAAVGLAGQAPVYWRQFRIIHENGKLMDRVVDKLQGENVRIAL